MQESNSRMINRDAQSLLVGSFGSIDFEDKSIFHTCQQLNISQIFLVYDVAEKGKESFEDAKIELIRHFDNLDIKVIFEEVTINNLAVESLFLAQALASQLLNERQIIIDSNTGHRYLRTLLLDAVSWVLLISQTFFKRRIILFEAIRLPNNKKTHFYSSQLMKINPQAFKIIPYVSEGIGESEIGENSGIKQSTVSIHLKTLRRLDLIEGKTKKNRKKTLRGSILLEIYSILNDKLIEIK